MPRGIYKLKIASDGQAVLLLEMGRLGLKQKDLLRLTGLSRSTLYFQRKPEHGIHKGGTTRPDTAYRIATALAQTALDRPPTPQEQDSWLQHCFEPV